MSGTPTMLIDILNNEDFDTYDTSTMRYVSGGGAPVTQSLINETTAKMGARVSQLPVYFRLWLLLFSSLLVTEWQRIPVVRFQQMVWWILTKPAALSVAHFLVSKLKLLTQKLSKNYLLILLVNCAHVDTCSSSVRIIFSPWPSHYLYSKCKLYIKDMLTMMQKHKKVCFLTVGGALEILLC